MAGIYDTLRRISLAKKALRTALEAACIAYANGGTGQAAPIVDDRYKGQGNKRFAPLSDDYARRKPLLLAAHGKVTGGSVLGGSVGSVPMAREFDSVKAALGSMSSRK